MSKTPPPTTSPLPEVPPVGFDDQTEESSAQNPYEPMKGIKCWINSGNGFGVMGVGFWADPEKDTDEFRKMMADQMGGVESSDFQRYMMMNWKVRKGDVVFPEFIDKPGDPTGSHVLIPKTPVPRHWSRRRGLDPGIRNPFAVSWAAKSPEGIHFFYRELYIRNAYDLRQNTPQGWMTGLNVIKYRIYMLSRAGGVLEVYDQSVCDVQSIAPTLQAGVGFEKPRSNILEDIRQPPYPIEDCVSAHRSGAEYMDVERIRSLIFKRKRYKVLHPDTLAFLGIEHNPAGYDLFGGYFLVNCKAHIFEFKNLRWEETVDDSINRPEKIQDVDNHAFDAVKYILFEDWDPNKPRPVEYEQIDPRKARAGKAQRDYLRASRRLSKSQKAEKGLNQGDLW